jgi:hypothetical protein
MRPRRVWKPVTGISPPSSITNVYFVVSLYRAVWLPPSQAGAGSLTGVRRKSSQPSQPHTSALRTDGAWSLWRGWAGRKAWGPAMCPLCSLVLRRLANQCMALHSATAVSHLPLKYVTGDNTWRDPTARHRLDVHAFCDVFVGLTHVSRVHIKHIWVW